MTKMLSIPKRLIEEQVSPFIEKLWGSEGFNEVVIDFSQVEYAQPFGTLLLAAEIKNFISLKGSTCQLSASGISMGTNSALSYLAHIGFFQFVGINFGNSLGASGNQNYIPITVTTRSQLLQRISDSAAPIGKAVQEEAERLAKILTKQNNLTINQPIAYCLREILRNVFEHGAVDECIWSAQSYYKGETEIAIVDRGRGIRVSLSERYPIQSDAEALALAVKPGVSRVNPSNDDDIWANSGFGLFVLSELGKRTGGFKIVSGDALLFHHTAGTEIRPAKFHGTAVGLRIAKPPGQNFAQFIEKIVEDGERQLQVIGEPKRASKSSKLV